VQLNVEVMNAVLN